MITSSQGVVVRVEKAVVEEVHQTMTLMGAKLMAMIMMTGELIINNSMAEMKGTSYPRQS